MKTFHVPRTRSVRVLRMLEEMGPAYEAVKIGFAPTDPEFLALNPAGALPLLIDGDVRRIESLAVLQYLGARHGPTPRAVAPDEAEFPDYLQFLEVGEAASAAVAGAAGLSEGQGVLGNQDAGANGVAGFQRLVGLSGVLQGEALANVDLHRAGLDHVEQRARALGQLLWLCDVVEQRGAGEVERAHA